MKYVKLLIILCLVSITVGCSFFGTKQPDEEGDRQLSILVGEYNDPLSADVVRILRELIVDFEKLHPGTTVTINTSMNQAEVDDLLLAAEPGEEIPNILLVQPNKLNKYIDREIFTDLTMYANNDQLVMSDFYKPLLDHTSRDGEWLTIPFAPNPLVVYYNKEWFEQANVAYPEPDWTWQDFKEAAQLLKQSRTESEQYGGLLALDLILMEPIIQSYGGGILSPDGKQANGYLNSDASVKAVQFIVDFLREQQLERETINPTDSHINHLIRQKTGMIISSANAAYFLQPEMGDRLGIASLPRAEGGDRTNPITILGISIIEQSDDKQLAWELLKMLTIDANKYTQQWSQWLLVNNLPLAKSTGQDVDPFKTILLDELNYITPSAIGMNENYVNIYQGGNTLHTMMNQMFSKHTSEEILDQLRILAQFIDDEMSKSEATRE